MEAHCRHEKIKNEGESYELYKSKKNVDVISQNCDFKSKWPIKILAF